MYRNLQYICANLTESFLSIILMSSLKTVKFENLIFLISFINQRAIYSYNVKKQHILLLLILIIFSLVLWFKESYYLVDIIVAALCVGVIGAGLFFGGKALVNCYTKHCLDEISPLVALISLAILVWGAKLMPLNIVLLLIISHAAYIFVRWYIDGYKEARGLR